MACGDVELHLGTASAVNVFVKEEISLKSNLSYFTEFYDSSM